MVVFTYCDEDGGVCVKYGSESIARKCSENADKDDNDRRKCLLGTNCTEDGMDSVRGERRGVETSGCGRKRK